MLLNNVKTTKDDFPHIHDWNWGHLAFDYSSKSIKLEVVLPSKNKKKEYIFFDVIHCEMSLGDPWGESMRIDCMEIYDTINSESEIVKAKFGEKLIQSYILVCFYGISGDSIKIICRDLSCQESEI